MQNLTLFDINDKFLDNRKNLEILRPHHNMVIRKIIINKLNQLKISTRCFNSSDFEHIYIVLKIQPSILGQRAERDEYQKAFELGILDLISYDPIDSLNRPFRLKTPEFKEYVKEKKNQKDNEEIFANN